MKEQIEEMANIIDWCRPIVCKFSCGFTAEKLYNAGYRKQNKGKWEKRTFIIFDSEKVGYICSECNTTWDTKTKFCPNCGSKMKGANDER